MGKFDELLETAGNFVNDNKGLVIGGLGGAALGAGASYGLSKGDEGDSPSQKFKKRLRNAVYGGLLGGVAGGGAGMLFDDNGIVSKLSEQATGGSDVDIMSPIVHKTLDAAGMGTAAGATHLLYNKWLKNPIQNSVNRELIEKLEKDVYDAAINASEPSLSEAAKKAWEGRHEQAVATLERLHDTGFYGQAPTKGLNTAKKGGKAGSVAAALLTLLGLENYAW